MLLNHFSYFCWAMSQNDPMPALQDFIDFGDVALHDGVIRADMHCAERYKVVTGNRPAPNR
eukprot:9215346-Alexandrium_andersonii.AAC.1